jgi:uncharacterized protein YkwD
MRFRNPLSAVATSLMLLIPAGMLTTGCSSSDNNPIDPGTSASSTFQSKSPFSGMEQVIVDQINNHRASIGLAPFKNDPTIAAEARKHSEAMATRAVPVSHTGYYQRIAAIDKVIPIHSAVENVTFNYSKYDPVGNLLMTWLNNPALKNNLEGLYDLTGIGVARGGDNEYYVTEIFVKRK